MGSADSRGSGSGDVGGVHLGAGRSFAVFAFALRCGRNDGAAFGHGAIVVGQLHFAGGAFDDGGEDLLEGGLVQRFAFEQLVGEVVEDIAVVRQRPIGVGVCGVDETTNFAIDRGQGRIPVFVAAAVAAPGEGLGLDRKSVV